MRKGGENIDLFFRLDANYSIGSGHLKRALVLGEALKTEFNSAFILKDTPQKIIQELIPESYPVFILPPEGHEAENICNIAARSGVKKRMIILDGDNELFYQKGYQIKLLENGNLLYHFTMYNRCHFYSHIIHNQNILALKQNYSAEEYTRFFLGPDYILLHPSFLTFNPKTSQKNKVETILLTFGGADRRNLLLKSLQELLIQIQDLKQIILVVGSMYNKIHELKEFIKGHPALPVSLFVNTQKMAELMHKADLAITSGGLTTWELAYLGVPHLVISSSEREKDTALELAGEGVIHYLGHYSQDELFDKKEAFWAKLQDKSYREELSANGRNLVDGKGLDRVKKALGGLLKS